MKFIREIDRGGFGRVEEIETESGERLARKVLDPNFNLSPEDMEKLRKRFEREVRIQQSLPSEIVMPIISHMLTGPELWYTMPLAEQSYLQKLKNDGPMEEFDLQPIADMLNGLQILHSLGYVHRDLKPANLLLHNGKWKLADFGLVMPRDSMEARYTSTSSWAGTNLYMAPEQFTDFKQVTELADIYSVGCILHDAVSGEARLPFQQHTCNGRLAPVIERATEVEAQRRFSDVRKLRDSLMSSLKEPSGKSTIPARVWIEDLAKLDEWDQTKVEEFARYLKSLEHGSDDADQICSRLDEDHLERLSKVDERLWEILVNCYTMWAQTGFDFDFCDVIVTRLEKIFEVGNASQKAAAVLAAAVLGSSHNRWFVMGRLLTMASPRLEDSLAQRISIEIRAESLEPDFVKCAAVSDDGLDAYHPRIREALVEYQERLENLNADENGKQAPF